VKQKCIGCAWCCATGPCLPALLKLGIPGASLWKDAAKADGTISWSPCPFLTWDGQRHWCSIHDFRAKVNLHWLFGPSDHCIMPENSWWYQPPRDRTHP
jgi:hypothetical protein